MLPGPDYIIACPYCETYARKQSLMSANTFGAEIWSDGFMIAMMFPDLPLVVRCSKCQNFYDTSKSQIIKEIYLGDEDDVFSGIEYVEHPEPGGYAEALQTEIANNPEMEFYLRKRHLWEMNHFFRKKRESGENPDWNREAYDQNLNRLLHLCADEDIIFRAEILRYLGKFEECISILSNAGEHESDIAEQIRKRANKKNFDVFLLK